MIKSFKCRDTSALFERKRVKRFGSIEAAARRKLNLLASAATLRDLASPPGNKLEPLKGDRLGQHSIRINDPLRICFIWTDESPEAVEIIDYH